MNQSFWQQLERPFTAQAPMSGVTDHAFRQILAKYGKPDVIWTEFVPADGLCSPGLDNLRHNLLFSEVQRPIVAQIYGCDPVQIKEASRVIAQLEFDGVDLNMGCPARPLERRGSGAALIGKLELACRLVEAAREGAGRLPVSIKTRIGYSQDQTETWVAGLIKAQPAALTIHGRTRDEKYGGQPRWAAIARAADLARQLFPDAADRPLIIGNGDVMDLNTIDLRFAESGCDGVMCGRALYGNPWFFNRNVERAELPLGEILGVLHEHLECYQRVFNRQKPLQIIKKHFKSYLVGSGIAPTLRQRLLKSQSYSDIKEILTCSTR